MLANSFAILIWPTSISDLGYADYSEYLYGIPGLLIGAKKIQKKQSYSVKLNLI